MRLNGQRGAPCGVLWGACSTCLGEGLVTAVAAPTETAPMVHCPWCHQRWSRADVEPCPRPGVVMLADVQGAEAWVCRSHSAHASAAALANNTVQH